MAAESAVFTDRQQCEAEAVKEGKSEGLRVAGRIRRAPVVAQAAPGLTIASDTRGLWLWIYREQDGQVTAKCDRAFLSRDECVADASANGWPEAPGRSARKP